MLRAINHLNLHHFLQAVLHFLMILIQLLEIIVVYHFLTLHLHLSYGLKIFLIIQGFLQNEIQSFHYSQNTYLHPYLKGYLTGFYKFHLLQIIVRDYYYQARHLLLLYDLLNFPHQICLLCSNYTFALFYYFLCCTYQLYV